jgi:tRNA(Arg) A34 adenosine deaminase TadA
VLAIRKAASKLNTYNLSECDLYTTLEPCPMCAYAISLARINKLYFAAYDEKRGAISSNNIFENKCTFHSPEVYDGIMEEQSKRILDRFFKKLRNQ